MHDTEGTTKSLRVYSPMLHVYITVLDSINTIHSLVCNLPFFNSLYDDTPEKNSTIFIRMKDMIKMP